MKRISLEITSNLGDVALVSVAIHAICIYACLGPDKASLVELSIVEALTNSIQHAYHSEPDQKMNMTISVDEDSLRFDLYDAGTPMLMEQVDRLIQGHEIVESDYADYTAIPENGRGLEIIRRTMDEIAYTRESDRNHLMLMIRRGPA